MYWYTYVHSAYMTELCQRTRIEIEEMRQIMEQNTAAINEIQSIVRQNHQLLTLLYSRQFGAYPPRYE